ncbi:MAG: site-specific integrase, partial [Lachnospiraceae bacterium]|nr:site-specific integrase [Lachnospiraceae bacterium]
MAAKKTNIPDYGTTMRAGIEYYRTRVKNADGKMVELYALTKEELYQKEMALRAETEDILFRRKNPTVAEYCEKWLKIRSATVSQATLEGYKSKVHNYIVKPLGDMYMADVTSDDIRVALVPVSKKSASVYNTVNMLFKCIFYNAERAQVIDYNP